MLKASCLLLRLCLLNASCHLLISAKAILSSAKDMSAKDMSYADDMLLSVMRMSLLSRSSAKGIGSLSSCPLVKRSSSLNTVLDLSHLLMHGPLAAGL